MECGIDNINIGDVITLKDGQHGIAEALGKHGEITLRCGNKKISCFYPGDIERVSRSKRVRIYQLEINSEFAFMNYEWCLARNQITPPSESYEVVFDGQLITDDLEKIYRIFNLEHPQGYTGRSLSISDIVELYDDYGGKYFFCDTVGFKEIPFKPLHY